MSSTSLSLDISTLVSRSLRGEAIDTAAAGHELATRYPDLGMSGELIGKAIARAAGMIRAAQNGEPLEEVREEPAADLTPAAEAGALATADEGESVEPPAPAGNRASPPLYDAALEAASHFAAVPLGLFRRASRA